MGERTKITNMNEWLELHEYRGDSQKALIGEIRESKESVEATGNLIPFNTVEQ